MKCCEKTLYRNGCIVTLDATDNRAEAVLTAGDRIEAVGTAEELRRLGGSRLKEVNLDGAVVYPGFIDTHSHPDLLASWAAHAYCGGAGDLASTLGILQRHSRGHDQPIPTGYGFDDMGIAEKRGPTREEMDALFPDRPVLLLHISIHAAYINSHMYRLMGISPDAPSDNPDVVCENGRPNGLITETLVLTALGHLPPVTLAGLKRDLGTAVEQYNAQGFTACIGGGAGLGGLSPWLVYTALAELENEGRLHMHAHMPVHAACFDEVFATGLLSGPGSPLLRFHGMKLLVDGSIQAFTAAVPAGYHSRPQTKPAPIIPQKELDDLVFKAHSAGQQAILHGNGDGAITSIIRAVEKAQARCPRKNPRHLLIHCQMASDEQLERMKAAGLWPSFFALHVWNWGDRHREIFLGPTRAARIDPCGSAVRLGLPFSLHADTPVLPQMTMQSIHTAVNRITSAGLPLGPEQRVSALDALRAYTTHAAAMCFEEKRRGSIEPGKLADFTLLDADPRAVPAEDINRIHIVSTVSMGRPVWGALKP
ncbi:MULTISPECIES: amidohydrolase [unclassified Desulfovibrio]|uniref:amidohydrolase n=1 Tax=unclassified Desulfovibrio TaxID=2593640 RepID=UPI000F5EF92F|nr:MULTISPECIES: amidohydrolase [unclassified Desulfovibrio]RRD70910.1 amidohydrolase [Desulfovibrio sp. OH1209_COT-279]RRD87283.1 amidohydrolase [Desulfovibrio sp. OH1186_COT-070]